MGTFTVTQGFLEPFAFRLSLFGYNTSAGAGTFPATLQGFLVPLAKFLNRFGYAVS